MSAVTVGPPEVEVEYPEGEPVPEDDLHWTRQSEVVLSLRHWLAGHPDGDEAWVSASINIYYREGDPRVVVAPDVAVAFGVDVAALAGGAPTGSGTRARRRGSCWRSPRRPR